MLFDFSLSINRNRVIFDFVNLSWIFLFKNISFPNFSPQFMIPFSEFVIHLESALDSLWIRLLLTTILINSHLNHNFSKSRNDYDMRKCFQVSHNLTLSIHY